MSFVSVLRRVGLIAGVAAPEVIAAANPGIGAIANTVLQAIVLAEARSGRGNGEDKKQDALTSVQIALPLFMQVMQASSGKTLQNPALLASGIDKLNDGIVDILNAFRVLPKES